MKCSGERIFTLLKAVFNLLNLSMIYSSCMSEKGQVSYGNELSEMNVFLWLIKISQVSGWQSHSRQ